MNTASGVSVTRLGLGNYLGHLDDATDERLLAVTSTLLEAGVNHFDTAPNYRAERSETVLGRALAAFPGSRSNLFLGTKVGFLPFRRQVPQDANAWIRARFVEPGFASAEDIIAGAQCFSPGWIRRQLDESLARLGTGYVDVLYLHNLETAFRTLDAAARERVTRQAFGALGELRAAGKLVAFGIASWGGFIEEGGEPLSIETLRIWAEREGCLDAFRYVQAPFNLSMSNALLRPTQTVAGKRISLARALADCGMELISSAPLFHGRLAEIDIPDGWRNSFPGLTTAQICLAMACSAPGIASTVVGVKSADHLSQLRELLARPPLPPRKFAELLRS